MANKLFIGIAVGAVAGAAISLLNRETREKTAQQFTNIKTDVQYFVNSRDEVKANVTGKFGAVQSLLTNVMENKDYYLEKFAELQSYTPEVKKMLTNTKDAFVSEDEIQEKKSEEANGVIHL